MSVDSVVRISGTELKVLARNRVAFSTTILIPIALCTTLFVAKPPPGLSASFMLLQLALLLGLSTFVSAVVALSARRESLYLKRLRTTTASDTSILLGISLPFIALSAVQAMMVVTAGVITRSEHPNYTVLVFGIAFALIQLTLVSFATSGFSRSVEQAQLIASPVFTYVVLIALWIVADSSETARLVQPFLPLGGTFTVISEAYGTVDAQRIFVSVAMSLIWGIAFALVARKTFRWEPRS
ncbi:hypothetical protein [Rathayibacter toxicus]|uniref:hypothetical protein n=1 Tax=Rathayibacter toxicus TaxID=145458 RepID=UPI000CE84A04|nr:hypothetical protein [Rathayibacter toxicus]PPI56830.1 hypothetical protein C5D35_00870 [Rathayibacter toxicus]QOD10402.1 hypothetical protein BSG36_10985 [Rathayibacter toxicus]QWL29073.1 hypothetical protein E2R33_10985 [Rathayibacter toxicus]